MAKPPLKPRPPSPTPHHAPAAPSAPTAPAAAADTARINEQIRVPEVRLIDEKGEQVGIVSRQEALSRAIEASLDLVEVAPQAKPPVCKIMDYTKFKYQKAVRERLARKKQTRIDIKEIKFRPATDVHDFDVKLRSIRKFLDDGDKVKCTLRFRGREMAHQDLGMALLHRVRDVLGEEAKVEQVPKLMGRQMTMVLAPGTAPKKAGGGESES
ncbi:MAG: translation initiation factor IF-3 [Magnetococcales bacterium]|nr:translation initiation factor IF-3 [Magnetococcales bacterium]